MMLCLRMIEQRCRFYVARLDGKPLVPVWRFIGHRFIIRGVGVLVIVGGGRNLVKVDVDLFVAVLGDGGAIF